MTGALYLMRTHSQIFVLMASGPNEFDYDD